MLLAIRDALIGIAILLGLWFTVTPPVTMGRPVQFCVAGLVLLGLVVRNRLPLLAFILAAGSTAVGWWLGLTSDPFILAGLCLYAYAERYGRRPFPRWLLLGVAALLASILMVHVEGPAERLQGILVGSVVLGTAWVFGVRTRHMREETAERVRAQERLRLVRDVHDTLSHSLGTIGVRAGVLAHIDSPSRDDLRAALREIEDEARHALDELRGLLTSEREMETQAATSSLSALIADVVHSAQRVGLVVKVSVDERLDSAPVAVRTTLYRVIQEAVTNVVRHAQATTCTIEVWTDSGNAYARVTDNGTQGSHGFHEGLGLRGLRERVALLRGRVEVNPRESGTVVEVIIPT